jgi:hypothetical protein
MNQHMQIQTQFHDAEIMDQAMNAFLMNAVVAKNKTKKMRLNMECRRKLEIKWEERRLQREISEFDFN